MRDFGAKPEVADSSVQIQAALNCGAAEVTLGDASFYRAAVDIPAGVTLRTDGARLKPVASSTATHMVRTAGAGASLRGVVLDFSGDTGLLGGELAVQIRHDYASIDNCQFLGNGYRWGVLIQAAGVGTCHHPSITRNRFDGTCYGVFKQGSTGTAASNIEIVGNRFKGIRRGDAIELNVGGDFGHVIERNWIEDVTINGAANAGLGIGVAGDGVDLDDLDTFQQAFSITGNVVVNCEAELIHVEVGAYFVIERNTLEQRDAFAGTAKAIATYGCRYGNIKHNAIRDCDTGIYDDPAVVEGGYIPSTTGQIIESNHISGCTTRGILSGVSGERRTVSVRKNVVRDCAIGIEQNGAAAVIFDDNQINDCPIPMKIDMAPVVKGALAATYSRILHATNNKAYSRGLPQPLDNVVANIGAATIYERGNNFLIADGSDIADHHLPGDIVIDDGTPKVCLTPGWTQNAVDTYYFTATATNDYIVITSPGDPAVAFKVGQMLSLPGVGPAGATLKAYIQRLYVATSQYRIELSSTISTSVGSSTAITLGQLATYATLD